MWKSKLDFQARLSRVNIHSAHKIYAFLIFNNTDFHYSRFNTIWSPAGRFPRDGPFRLAGGADLI